MPIFFPDFIVHYSRATPFLSITKHSENEWPQILADLNTTNAWGLSRFADPKYLIKRQEVEARLRNEFVNMGGTPQLTYPIYFFLGRNESFEKSPLNIGYQISLQDLPDNSVSFTYGDSLLAFDGEYRSQSGEKYQNKLCGKVFLKSDLAKIYEALPANNGLHVEAQLWIEPPAEIVKVIKR